MNNRVFTSVSAAFLSSYFVNFIIMLFFFLFVIYCLFCIFIVFIFFGGVLNLLFLVDFFCVLSSIRSVDFVRMRCFLIKFVIGFMCIFFCKLCVFMMVFI